MGKHTTEMKMVETSKLIPYVNNARTHSQEQVNKLRGSLREFGFINPVIIDSDFNVIAGHGRLMAAKEEGIEEVPCVLVDYLTEAQKKAYILADNRYAQDAGWDEELLRLEIEALEGMDFDVWELAGIYADDGISGTNTKKREGFNEMIDDCMAGKVDMIITKSISRFARNTIDCLKYVRQLREKNIAIIFEKENINTLEASGELLLTIMASLAQQESASLSQNVKLGLQFRYQEGKVIVNHEHFLGYTKDAKGNLIVDKKEAKIVKRIFREYLEGSSFRDIAMGLERDHIKTGGKRYKWHMSTVRGILSNEKYIGDALLQKTITTDFIEKTRIKNDGTVPQYYVKNSQEAIIPRDIFTQVQEEMLRRANMTSGRDGQKRRIYSSRYALSSICTCMKCGDIYRRVAWNNRGKKSVVWRCCTRVEHGPSACSAPTIPEEELQQAIVDAMNVVLESSGDVKNILEENILEVIYQDNSDAIDKINKEISEKQKELLELVHGKKDYSKCADEMEELRQNKQLLLVEHAKSEGTKQRINELSEYINSENTQITEYDEKLVRKYIDQIKVYDDRFVICFKAKLEIVIQR